MTDSNCMWKAPQRLGTSYPGNGFENAYGGPKEDCVVGLGGLEPPTKRL